MKILEKKYKIGNRFNDLLLTDLLIAISKAIGHLLRRIPPNSILSSWTLQQRVVSQTPYFGPVPTLLIDSKDSQHSVYGNH